MSRVNDLCWPEQLPPWPDFQPLGSSLSLLFFSTSYILLVVQEFLFLAWTWCLLSYFASLHTVSSFSFGFYWFPVWVSVKSKEAVHEKEEEGCSTTKKWKDVVRERLAFEPDDAAVRRRRLIKPCLWLMQLKESADLFPHVVTSCLWHHYSFYDTSRIFSTCSSFCHTVAITHLFLCKCIFLFLF